VFSNEDYISAKNSNHDGCLAQSFRFATTMERSTTIFTLAAVTVATGLVAYAVYFDYRRRNDADFRKKLSWFKFSLCHTNQPTSHFRKGKETR
jgi:hypothetical protein